MYAKLRKYIKEFEQLTEPKKAAVASMTPEMLSAIGDSLKIKLRKRKPFTTTLPLMVTFNSRRSLANFERAGIDAFFYGDYATFGDQNVVLPDQFVMFTFGAAYEDYAHKFPAFEEFQETHTKHGILLWLTERSKTHLIKAAIGDFASWGLPW